MSVRHIRIMHGLRAGPWLGCCCCCWGGTGVLVSEDEEDEEDDDGDREGEGYP